MVYGIPGIRYISCISQSSFIKEFNHPPFTMPTFENFIMAAPAGFSQSCSSLNNLANSDGEIERLVSQSLKAANFTTPRTSESFDIKAINFILRSYKSAIPLPTFPQMAAVLDQNTLLTRDCVEKLIVAIQSNGVEDTSPSASLLSQVIIFSNTTLDFVLYCFSDFVVCCFPRFPGSCSIFNGELVWLSVPINARTCQVLMC